MSERSFEKIARGFAEKGLAGMIEAQTGKSATSSVLVSLRCARSLRKQVAIEEQPQRR